MSSLAPFVASAIKDKVIADMMDEITELKSELLASRKVQLTGPKGNPVYAEAQLNNDIPSNSKDVSSSGIEIPIESFEMAQIHLGGVCMADIVHSSSAEAYVEEFNQDEQEANVNIYFKHGLWLSTKVRPLTLERFQQLSHKCNNDVNPEEIFEDIIFDEKSGIKTIHLDCIMFSGKTASFVSFKNWTNDEEEEEISSVRTIG